MLHYLIIPFILPVSGRFNLSRPIKMSKMIKQYLWQRWLHVNTFPVALILHFLYIYHNVLTVYIWVFVTNALTKP